MVCCISSKRSWQGLQLCFKLYFNRRSTHKVIGLQSDESPHFENFETPNLGVLGQNDIWMQASWPCTKNTIRGKVVASLKFMLWWILWIRVCSWLVHAPKMFQLRITNLLFGLCRSMWVIDLLITLFSPHHEVLACPSTPKCCELGSVPNSLSFRCFHPLDS